MSASVSPALSAIARPAPLAREAVHLVGIQQLRAVAALAVVVHHSLEESHVLFGSAGLNDGVVLAGAFGVDLFFVISGFIMLHTNWSQFGVEGAQPTFLLRRAIRIFPMYWLCLAFILAAKASGLLYRGLIVTPDALFASLLLLPTGRMLHGVAWTLVFEMYFYLLFSFWLRAQQPGRAVVGVPVLIGVIAALAAVLPFEDTRRYLADPIAFEFTFGLVLAWAWRRVSWRPPPAALAAGALLLIVLAAAAAPRDGTMGLARSVRFVAWGVPAAMLVYAALQLRSTGSAFERVMVFLGDASYSLYLTHAFVMTSYARVLKIDGVSAALPAGVGVALAVATSIALGCVMYRFVERPIIAGLRPWAR
jgi:peptidoglycan/LPS O-acetylase OafA/YrhL